MFILLNDKEVSIVKVIIMLFKDVNVYFLLMFFLFIKVVIGILKMEINDVIVVKNISKKNKLVIIDVFM